MLWHLYGTLGTEDKIKNGKKYRFAWEFVLLHKLRDWSDGVTWLEFVLNSDKFDADHTPRFKAHLIILNHTIVEFDIYNIYHSEDVADSGACGIEEC